MHKIEVMNDKFVLLIIYKLKKNNILGIMFCVLLKMCNKLM